MRDMVLWGHGKCEGAITQTIDESRKYYRFVGGETEKPMAVGLIKQTFIINNPKGESK